MGCGSSKVAAAGGGGGGSVLAKTLKRITNARDYKFYAIEDKFTSLEEVSDALREAGLEASQLVRCGGGGARGCGSGSRPLTSPSSPLAHTPFASQPPAPCSFFSLHCR